MYLLKSIVVDKQKDSVDVENGIPCLLINGKLEAYDEFWGRTEIVCFDCMDWERIKKNDNDEYILSYCNEMKSVDMGDGYKKLYINVTTPNDIEGYIIFVKFTNEEIKTNGKKIFGRYPNEGIFILENGQELILDGHIVKVLESNLYLAI